MNTPPRVLVDDQVVIIGNNLNAVNFLNAVDDDGDPIVRYRVMDTFQGQGHLELDGVRRDANVWVAVSASQLARLQYVSDDEISRETLRVQAFDGEVWSESEEFLVYSAFENENAPRLRVTPFRVTANERINVAGWIRGFDPIDGHPITRWKFRDRRVGGGYFLLDGERLREGTGNGDSDWIYVENEDIGRLRYVGALNQQQEIIDVRVRDTSLWSPVETVFATTVGNFNRPDVVGQTHILPVNVTVDFDQNIFFNDADGNTAKLYEVMDTSIAPGSGFFSVFGVQQEAKQWITLTPQEFRNSTFTTANNFRDDQLRVRVFDGKFWSPIDTVVFRADVKPEITFDSSVLPFTGAFDVRQVIDLFDRDPSGLFFQRYQVVDLNPQSTDPGSGDLRLFPTNDNPGSLSDGRIHTLTPSEANSLLFVGGRGPRNVDQILVRANNGRFWSDWERLPIHTEPNWNALGTTWLDVPAPPFGREIQYSFADFFRDDDRETGDAQNAVPLGGQVRQAFRQLFTRLNVLLEDVDFVEVPDSFVQPNNSPHGLIRIHGWIPDNFDPLPVCSFGFGPTDHSTFDADQEGGDIWITLNPFGGVFCGEGNSAVDTFEYQLYATEILNAIGRGGATDPDALVSLAGDPFARSRDFGIADILALQQVYGADTDTNNTDTIYSPSTTWAGDTNLSANIYDTGGVDTLDLRELSGNVYATIEQGDISTQIVPPGEQAGFRAGITYGTEIENVITGGGNDILQGNQLNNVLRGNAGNDEFFGWGGDDTIFGGAGNDTYHWSLADGRDTINEETSAGRDRIVIEQLPNLRLNDLAQDVTFRRTGRDLVINFDVDNDITHGSLTIKDQLWGGSRIETLNIFGVDLDLTRIFAQTRTIDTKFDIDFASDATVFGNLVATV